MDVVFPKTEENMLATEIQVFESVQNDGLDDNTECDLLRQLQRTFDPGFDQRKREKHCFQRHWTWKAIYGG